MFEYEFPTFFKIDNVLDAIRDSDGFIVSDKGLYTVINYVHSDSTTFPPITDNNSALRRECRGLIFCNKTKEIISRPFHKFFNAFEREEVLPNNIDLTKPHSILEKLDGSFVRPFITSDGILRFGTKMGETTVSEMITDFISKNKNYEEFCRNSAEASWTPIFEFMSRKNRIVLNYGNEDRLVLLAYRNNFSGRYFTYKQLQNIANIWNIDVVKKVDIDFSNVSDLHNTIQNMNGIEGFVITFDSGHRIKMKTAEYVQLHRVKDSIQDERAVVQLIIDEKLDDTYGFLTNEEVDRLKKFEDQVRVAISRFANRLFELKQSISVNRKEFAINYTECALSKSIMFKVWDANPTKQELAKLVELTLVNSLSQLQKYQSIKSILNFGDIDA